MEDSKPLMSAWRFPSQRLFAAQPSFEMSASLLLNKLFRGSLPFVGGFAQSIDKNEVKVDGLSGIKGVITVGRIRLQLGSLIMVRIGDQKAPAEWGF